MPLCATCPKAIVVIIIKYFMPTKTRPLKVFSTDYGTSLSDPRCSSELTVGGSTVLIYHAVTVGTTGAMVLRPGDTVRSMVTCLESWCCFMVTWLEGRC